MARKNLIGKASKFNKFYGYMSKTADLNRLVVSVEQLYVLMHETDTFNQFFKIEERENLKVINEKLSSAIENGYASLIIKKVFEIIWRRIGGDNIQNEAIRDFVFALSLNGLSNALKVATKVAKNIIEKRTGKRFEAQNIDELLNEVARLDGFLEFRELVLSAKKVAQKTGIWNKFKNWFSQIKRKIGGWAKI